MFRSAGSSELWNRMDLSIAGPMGVSESIDILMVAGLWCISITAGTRSRLALSSKFSMRHGGPRKTSDVSGF